MRIHGHAPSFRIDTDDGERTIFSNGTIINHPHAAMFERLGRPGGALGFVVADPEQVLDAEPGLPIAFVKTNALYGSAIVCRKHVLHMGRKPPAWTSRRPHQVPAADS